MMNVANLTITKQQTIQQQVQETVTKTFNLLKFKKYMLDIKSCLQQQLTTNKSFELSTEDMVTYFNIMIQNGLYQFSIKPSDIDVHIVYIDDSTVEIVLVLPSIYNIHRTISRDQFISGPSII